MPPTEIFDDTVEPTSSSDNTKQVTFSNTTSSHEYKDTSDEQVTPPPKKTSRIVWQEHVEVLEWINENQNPECKKFLKMKKKKLIIFLRHYLIRVPGVPGIPGTPYIIIHSFYSFKISQP